MDGEDSGVAADVAEVAVGGARKDLAAVATEELNGGPVFGYHGLS